MYNLNAFAVRTDGSITVTILGSRANGNTMARIAGTFPGSIVHVVDPGFAEVYLEEDAITPGAMGTMSLYPWIATVQIQDDRHEKVAIRIANQIKLIVTVTSTTFAADKDGQGSEISRAMSAHADDIADFIREHDIGGEVGKDIAAELDKATNRTGRGKIDQDR